MLKKNSEAWRIARAVCRRKGVARVPVALSDDGQTVEFMSLIRGNKWKTSLSELRLIKGA